MPSLFSFVFQGQGAGSSCPPPPSEINANEIYFVKLVKEDGTLGFSVTVRIIRQDWEVHSCKNVHLEPLWASHSYGNLW